MTSFNPRPSRKRGATTDGWGNQQDVICFNPRPSRKRGATVISQWKTLIPYKFQSSPLSQEGRYAIRVESLSKSNGFNPRPSRKRGATPRFRQRARSRLVSILAPLARGALQYYKNLPHFQIVNPSIRRTSLSYLIVPLPFVNPHVQTPHEIRTFSHPRIP